MATLARGQKSISSRDAHRGVTRTFASVAMASSSDLFTEGLRVFLSCKKPESVPKFTKYLERNPDHFYARLYRGTAHKLSGDKDAAAKDYKFVMESSKSDEAQKMVAKAALTKLPENTESNKESLKILQDAYYRYANNAMVNHYLGVELYHSGRHDEAQPYLMQAIRLGYCFSGVTHYILGSIFEKKGVHQKAASEFQLSLSQFNCLTLAHLDLAQSLKALGRNAEAETHLRTASVLNPALYQEFVTKNTKNKLEVSTQNSFYVAKAGGNTYYLIKEFEGKPNNRFWFVKDTTGHAGCRYKVYINRKDSLEFSHGVDEYGKRIPKAESMKGHTIKKKNLAWIKVTGTGK